MKLYFENSYGEKRLLGNYKTERGALRRINKFCEDITLRFIISEHHTTRIIIGMMSEVIRNSSIYTRIRMVIPLKRKKYEPSTLEVIRINNYDPIMSSVEEFKSYIDPDPGDWGDPIIDDGDIIW